MSFMNRSASLELGDGNAQIKSSNCRSKIKKPYVVVIGTILVVAIIILIVIFTGAAKDDDKQVLDPPNPTKAPKPSPSVLHRFQRAAVCADGVQCAQIGKDILLKNGSAVDAALGAAFCNGLINMHSMGIGGGFLMTIYTRQDKKGYALNARERAPLAATADMFGKDSMASKKGPLAIGVPGELKGYWAAHQKFGKISWKEVVMPTVEMCEGGYTLTLPQLMAIKTNKNLHPTLRRWLYDSQGEIKKVGEKINPKELCTTLRHIAENGIDDFYKGKLAEEMVEELKSIGSILTKEDFSSYDIEWREPVTFNFTNSDTLYSIPPPGSGVLLGYILKILDGYNFDPNSLNGFNNTILTYHRMLEAFKFAYAKRTLLADDKFVDLTALIANLTDPEYAEETRLRIDDSRTHNESIYYGEDFADVRSVNGTAHISVLAENGDAVSITSTVNLYFGANIVSNKTGVVFNSVMDDFSNSGFDNYFGLPAAPNNKIVGGKRPLSSMSPSIFTDREGDVKMVIGASGGTHITSAIAQIAAKVMWMGQNLKEAVDSPRIHHQFYPMAMYYEFGTTQQEVDAYKARGHETKRMTSWSVICALYRQNGTIFANADHRKGGDVYGLD